MQPLFSYIVKDTALSRFQCSRQQPVDNNDHPQRIEAECGWQHPEWTDSVCSVPWRRQCRNAGRYCGFPCQTCRSSQEEFLHRDYGNSSSLCHACNQCRQVTCDPSHLHESAVPYGAVPRASRLGFSERVSRTNCWLKLPVIRTFSCSTAIAVVVAAVLLLCRPCVAEGCLQGCDCKWRGGKETVECRNAGFVEVPRNLAETTQVLDLTGNKLSMLYKDLFLNVGLVHLQRIYLSHCILSQIDKEAFQNIQNLVELDLSHNLLVHVPSEAFQLIPQLRRLFLSNNPIEQLPAGSFVDMEFLEQLDFSNCKIHQIEIGAFRNLPKLSTLKIDGNRLHTISEKVVTPLPYLQTLHLDNNPWSCDCYLRALVEWMTDRAVQYSEPPNCTGPGRLSGRTWKVMEPIDFACEPNVTVLESQVTIFEEENVTLTCFTTGDPEPFVRWLWKGRAIANLSMMSSEKYLYLIHEETNNYEKVTNLTLTVAQKEDSGVYACVAENHANVIASNVSLSVIQEEVESEGLTSTEVSGLTVGLIISLVTAFFAVCFLFIRCKRNKNRRRREHKRKKQELNQKLLLVNSVNSLGNHQDYLLTTTTATRLNEHDLRLLGPNPIQKPPRLGQYQCVPTIDLDHGGYESKPYLPNSPSPYPAPGWFITQGSIEEEEEEGVYRVAEEERKRLRSMADSEEGSASGSGSGYGSGFSGTTGGGSREGGPGGLGLSGLGLGLRSSGDLKDDDDPTKKLVEMLLPVPEQEGKESEEDSGLESERGREEVDISLENEKQVILELKNILNQKQQELASITNAINPLLLLPSDSLAGVLQTPKRNMTYSFTPSTSIPGSRGLLSSQKSPLRNISPQLSTPSPLLWGKIPPQIPESLETPMALSGECDSSLPKQFKVFEDEGTDGTEV